MATQKATEITRFVFIEKQAEAGKSRLEAVPANVAGARRGVKACRSRRRLSTRHTSDAGGNVPTRGGKGAEAMRRETSRRVAEGERRRPPQSRGAVLKKRGQEDVLSRTDTTCNPGEYIRTRRLSTGGEGHAKRSGTERPEMTQSEAGRNTRRNDAERHEDDAKTDAAEPAPVLRRNSHGSQNNSALRR